MFAETLIGSAIRIETLFENYAHMRVIPEQSPRFRLLSYAAEHKIQLRRGHRWPRIGWRALPSTDIEIRTPNNFALELAIEHASESSTFTVDFHVDNVQHTSSEDMDGDEIRKLVLLLDMDPQDLWLVSIWMALKPAYVANGRQYYYREGLIKMRGALKWHDDPNKTPPDEIWLA